MRAYAIFLGVLAAGNLPIMQQHQLLDLPYFISLAVCTIYIGAHRGLTTKQRQQISMKEGLLAPVFASVALFSCYLLIKFFPDFNLQTFLNAYFWLLGSLAISGAAQPVLRKVTGVHGACCRLMLAMLMLAMLAMLRVLIQMGDATVCCLCTQSSLCKAPMGMPCA